MSRKESHAFFSRVFDKYRKEYVDEFDYFFNEGLIQRLSVKTENNWKHIFLFD